MMSSLVTSTATDVAGGEILVQDADFLSERVIAKMGLDEDQRMAVTGKTQLLERQFRARDEHLRPYGGELTGLVALSSAYDPWHDRLRLQGVYKGGWRLDPGVSGPEMCFLSRGMLDKADVLGIHKEGGKSGVIVDPTLYTPAELVGIARGFADCFRDILGSSYVAATDLGSKPEHMAAMAEVTGFDSVTGKPNALQGQSLCTGYGAAVMAFLAASYYGTPFGRGTKVGLHGAGRAGLVMAKYLYDWGCDIIAVSDAYGCVVCNTGLDIPALTDHVKDTHSVVGFNDTKLDRDAVLFMPLDLLAVASKENVLTDVNANDVVADYIAGPANGFGTWAAQEILRNNGKVYLTDRLDSLYGVYGSDMELEHFTGGVNAVLDRVKRKAEQDFHATIRVMKQFNFHSLTEGAQALAYTNRLASLENSLN